MRESRRLFILAGLLAAATSAAAQSDGRIAGSVRDASGAVLAGANVEVKDDRTGEPRTTTSDIQGRYVVPGLKPSIYTVRAELSGFQPFERRAIVLNAGQELRLEMALSVASQQEAITVSGELAPLDTSKERGVLVPLDPYCSNPLVLSTMYRGRLRTSL